MNRLLVIAVGMSLVTMIPRILPFFFMRVERLSPAVQNFFACLPAAMLTALVLPSVATASGSVPLSLAGAAAAVLLCLLKAGPTLTVAGSVILLYVLQVTGILH